MGSGRGTNGIETLLVVDKLDPLPTPLLEFLERLREQVP